MRWGLRPVVVAVLAGLPAAAAAEEASRIADADVARALEAAGENRPELEAFLARFDARGGEEREAARFLVGNLPGKGYALFELRDEAGAAIPFDPLSFETFAAAQEAYERIEAERGPVDFVRARVVEDVAAVRADALTRHVERALAVWRATPAARRPGFDAFLEHVLPHRGSEEPLDDWLGPLADRWAARAAAEPDAAALYAAVVREAGEEVRFDERYYLHPTDQGFSEMARSRMGRCEDITNRTTYGARAAGLATAADFTPAWGHRDNNHAWNVLLDARGRGSDPVGRRAPKVYRKTFAIQRDALASRLPPGREAPNRWLGSRTLRAVTDQYGETATLDVELDPEAAGPERFAYLAGFNGGEWVAVAWAAVEGGRARFPAVGRGLLYLPAVHDGPRARPTSSSAGRRRAGRGSRPSRPPTPPPSARRRAWRRTRSTGCSGADLGGSSARSPSRTADSGSGSPPPGARRAGYFFRVAAARAFFEARFFVEGTRPFPSPMIRIRSGNGPRLATGARVATGALFFLCLSDSGTGSSAPFDVPPAVPGARSLNRRERATDPRLGGGGVVVRRERMVLVVKRWVAVASLSTLFAAGAGVGWCATQLWPGLALAAPARPRPEPARAPATVPVPGTRYRIEPNDTLSEVSQRAYGTTRHVGDLLAANPGLDPVRIRPGTFVYVPFVPERPVEPAAPAPARTPR